jgi:hypothetical protein
LCDGGLDSGFDGGSDSGFDGGSCGCEGSLSCFCQKLPCPTSYDALVASCSSPNVYYMEEFRYPGFLLVEGVGTRAGFKYTFDPNTHQLLGAAADSDVGLECLAGSVPPYDGLPFPTSDCQVFCNKNDYLEGLPLCQTSDGGVDAAGGD